MFTWRKHGRGRASSDYELVEPATELRGFWDEMRRAHGIGETEHVVVVGDALVSFELKMSVATFTRYLVDILCIPHHTYVFPEDAS